MNHEKRSCVAFICALQLKLIDTNYIYDCVNHVYRRYHVLRTLKEDRRNIYDYQRRTYMVASFPNIFDCASGKYVNILMNKNTFRGYDYESESHFQGEVIGEMVRIYDYRQAAHFYYRLYGVKGV
ncbi:hypothetical protein [uncultured Bacteroides sp.]|jgi:hypothetical protein|uniref:hypothetical protein n=1 Tax=uncultured Bacteroides sp. TaxID=162156 RepID=UPI0025D3FF01|nr:hypothetical protein [uncultured Bacteroides sp.]